MDINEKVLVVHDNNVLLTVFSEMLSLLGTMYFPPIAAFACNVKKYSTRTPVVIMTGSWRESVFSKNNTSVDKG